MPLNLWLCSAGSFLAGGPGSASALNCIPIVQRPKDLVLPTHPSTQPHADGLAQGENFSWGSVAQWIRIGLLDC